MKKQILTSALAMGIALSWLAPDAMARLLYTDEVDSTDASKFIIDFDQDEQDEIVLQFGNTAGSGLVEFDLADDTFKFSNSVAVSGSLEVNGDVTLTGNVDIAGNVTLSGNLSLEGNELTDARVENVVNTGSVTVNGTADYGRIVFDESDEQMKYWNGTNWVTISGTNEDGTSTGGGAGGLKLVGVTSSMANGVGNFNPLDQVGFDGSTTGEIDFTGGKEGYIAANAACATDFGAGARMCQVSDIISSIVEGDMQTFVDNNFVTVWAAEGAPGFTANANDCNGWQNGTNDYLGGAWTLKSNGGEGTLINCSNPLPIACCQ